MCMHVYTVYLSSALSCSMLAILVVLIIIVCDMFLVAFLDPQGKSAFHFNKKHGWFVLPLDCRGSISGWLRIHAAWITQKAWTLLWGAFPIWEETQRWGLNGATLRSHVGNLLLPGEYTSCTFFMVDRTGVWLISRISELQVAWTALVSLLCVTSIMWRAFLNWLLFRLNFYDVWSLVEQKAMDKWLCRLYPGTRCWQHFEARNKNWGPNCDSMNLGCLCLASPSAFYPINRYFWIPTSNLFRTSDAGVHTRYLQPSPNDFSSRTPTIDVGVARLNGIDWLKEIAQRVLAWNIHW